MFVASQCLHAFRFVQEDNPRKYVGHNFSSGYRPVDLVSSSLDTGELEAEGRFPRHRPADQYTQARSQPVDHVKRPSPLATGTVRT